MQLRVQVNADASSYQSDSVWLYDRHSISIIDIDGNRHHLQGGYKWQALLE